MKTLSDSACSPDDVISTFVASIGEESFVFLDRTFGPSVISIAVRSNRVPTAVRMDMDLVRNLSLDLKLPVNIFGYYPRRELSYDTGG